MEPLFKGGAEYRSQNTNPKNEEVPGCSISRWEEVFHVEHFSDLSHNEITESRNSVMSLIR